MQVAEVLSLTSIILAFVGFYPYVRGTLKGVIRPHVFSWIIWSLTTIVVFFAQLYEGGGAGAWATGAAGAITLGIAVLAFIKRGSVTTTRSDKIFFGAALASLPVWYLTSDPLWAVVLLTTIDLLAFIPTGRKIIADPYSETISFYGVLVVRNGMGALALEHFSVTTVLFPVAIAAGAMVMILLMLIYRPKLSYQS